MEIKTLGDFITWEMKSRSLTIREFAKRIGSTKSQVHKFSTFNTIITKDSAESELDDLPSTKFLYLLAKGTSTDLAFIVALVFPDATQVDAVAGIINARVEQLPTDKRELFDQFLNWLSLQANQKTK